MIHKGFHFLYTPSTHVVMYVSVRKFGGQGACRHEWPGRKGRGHCLKLKDTAQTCLGVSDCPVAKNSRTETKQSFTWWRGPDLDSWVVRFSHLKIFPRVLSDLNPSTEKRHDIVLSRSLAAEVGKLRRLLMRNSSTEAAGVGVVVVVVKCHHRYQESHAAQGKNYYQITTSLIMNPASNIAVYSSALA